MENLSLKNVELSKVQCNSCKVIQSDWASDSCKEIEQPSMFINDIIERNKTPVNVIDDMFIVKREELAQGGTKENLVVSPCVPQSNKKCPRKGKLLSNIVHLLNTI